MSKIDWRKVDLNLLVAFTTLYRTRSVSSAATKSYVSQSAMSHTLQKLRKLFADPLFERRGYRMQPTDKADQLAPVIEQILQQISNDVLQQERFEPASYQGVVRVGLTDYAEQVFAPMIYDQLRLQAPHCRVSFINVNRSNYQQQFEAHKLDVVIGSISPLAKGYSSEHLYTEQHVCLYDPEMLSLSGSMSPQDFAGIEQVLLSPAGDFSSQVDRELASLGLTRHVVATASNFLTLARLIKGRHLICIIPRLMAQQTRALEYAAPPIPVSDFAIAAITLNHKVANEKSRWLRALLQQVVCAAD
ncbi:LysR family transcriptional regulator [Aliagarivorans taiwanensis]|uniref:LysR family transcriptional regulator n=1 Tax=Aliagarivorans taiwanensis TaxID=561966 RepID=UPI0003F8CA97|nr:LysR family transcriptional regulator [Aliagarivorans taiwanensis]